jgi:glycosyltransferase involved in cell wall biosynthesis
VSKPLRVLAVTNIWPEGGGFRGIFVREQVEALRRRGHTVDVEIVAQSRGKADYLTAAPRVRRRVRTGGYDLMHVHYGLTGLAGRFAGRVPRVLSLHGSDINVRWQRLATKLALHGYDARIYVSQRLADTAGDAAGHVIGNGVDFTLFRPADRAEARQRLGLPADAPIVLFGAAPDNWVKGYDVFSAVLAALNDRGIPARELILAAPDQPREQVPVKFAAADLLLFTSRQGFEGSPTVVKEATAMNLPVVSVDVGDVAKVLDGVSPSAVVPFPDRSGSRRGVRHAEPDRSFETADPRRSRDELVGALADRAAEILAGPTRSNGRERNSWLDEAKVAERIEAVYRGVIGVGA